MIIISKIISAIGISIILLCAASFFRSKNVFISVKIISTANLYGLSMLLIGFFLKNPSAAFAVKITLLLICNFILTAIMNRIIAKKAPY
jgi:multisubunit Na+/H+ antiporter MnhG subunit